MSVVLDASALLAVVFEERGANVVLRQAQGAIASAVNLDEVLHKGERRGMPASKVERLLTRLEIGFAPFDAEQARTSARLKPMVDGFDVSFADRACLALGLTSKRPILSSDTDWERYDLGKLFGLDIRLIR